MVSIESKSIAVGGTGFVDVRLISTGAEQLYGYSVEFEILSSNGRTLEFVNTLGVPPDTHLINPAVNDYVFADDGSAAITSGSSGFVGPSTSYVGLDVSNNLLGITGPFDRLLARLDLTTLTELTGNDPLAGDIFTIQLTNANGNTYFRDPALLDVDPFFDTNPVFGTVTITAAAAAVPEPGFALLSGIIVLSVAVKHRRSRRNLCLSKTTSDSSSKS